MKACVCILGILVFAFTGVTLCYSFSGTTAEAPQYKVGDSWIFENSYKRIGSESQTVTEKRQSKILQASDSGYVSSEKILNPETTATFCGEGTNVTEMVVKRDRNFTMTEITNPSGSPLKECSHLVGRKWLAFPMSVGKKWEFTGNVISTHQGSMQPHRHSVKNELSVESIDDIATPAGKFKVFKIKHNEHFLSCPEKSSKKGGAGGTAYYWYSPDQKRSVQETDTHSTVRYQLQSSELK